MIPRGTWPRQATAPVSHPLTAAQIEPFPSTAKARSTAGNHAPIDGSECRQAHQEFVTERDAAYGSLPACGPWQGTFRTRETRTGPGALCTPSRFRSVTHRDRGSLLTMRKVDLRGCRLGPIKTMAAQVCVFCATKSRARGSVHAGMSRHCRSR
jgi:hypothetical protein